MSITVSLTDVACLIDYALSCAVQNFTVDKCGPVHIIIGDGGNIEGVCEPFP